MYNTGRYVRGNENYDVEKNARVSHSRFIVGSTDTKGNCLNPSEYTVNGKYFEYAYVREHLEITVMDVKGTYTDTDTTVIFKGLSELLSKGTTYDSMEGRIIWDKDFKGAMRQAARFIWVKQK